MISAVTVYKLSYTCSLRILRVIRYVVSHKFMRAHIWLGRRFPSRLFGIPKTGRSCH